MGRLFKLMQRCIEVIDMVPWVAAAPFAHGDLNKRLRLMCCINRELLLQPGTMTVCHYLPEF